MKKYGIRLYIISFILLAFILILFGFGYTALSDRYIKEEAGRNLLFMTEAIAIDTEITVSRDYEKLTDLIDKAIQNNINSTIDLYNYALSHKNDIVINNVETINFGYVTDTSFIISNNSYDYVNDYAKIEFCSQNVGIYSFSEVFKGATNITQYVWFRYKNIVLYFSADSYLSKIFERGTTLSEGYYFIAGKDGRIQYQKVTNIEKNKLFENYIRPYNGNSITDSILNEFYENKRNYALIQGQSEQSVIAYVPLSTELSNLNLYIVYIFGSDAIQTASEYLQKSLLVFAIALLAFFTIVMFISIRMLVKQNENITRSKTVHYRAKVFAIVINKNGRIIKYNKTVRNNIKDCQNIKNIKDFVIYDGDENLLEAIKMQKGFTIECDSVNNNKIYIRLVTMKDSFGRYSLFGEDATAAIGEQLRNRQIALYNQVTKLPNKILLLRELENVFNDRTVFNQKMTLINLDIMNFRNINRVFGYTSADKMLSEVADILVESVAGYKARVYNIRTSAYSIFFTDLGHYNEAMNWATNILNVFKDPIDTKDNNLLYIDVRIGIFNIEADRSPEITPLRSYECAESALDRSRNSKQIKYSIYNSDFSQSMTREQVMEQDLKDALKNNEFMMFYQPQYNNKTNQIVGFEALIRWQNKKYRLESPEHFITLAEKNGMIIDIGKYIMEDTFKFAKSIEKYNVHISMNVSPVQLLQGGFVSSVLSVYKKYDLKRGSIAIEITETFLMENSELIIEKLRLLRDNGFHIHLDDFGIGYSSMLYLKDLPIDTIKIDKGFIKHVNNDKFSKAIVAKIVQLATQLDLEVIAEGVEDDKQNQFLQKCGCNIIQGYLIGKAMTEEEAVAIIERHNSSSNTDKTINAQKKK